MMSGMSPGRAQAAGEDLIALAYAVKSGDLEKDIKAYLAAAKKAVDADGKLSETTNALKAREEAAARKEASNTKAAAKIKADRDDMKADQDRWDARKATEQEDLIKDRTRLTVDASAVASRDQKATAMMSEAKTLMEAAKTRDEKARAMKADFEGRISQLEAISKGA